MNKEMLRFASYLLSFLIIIGTIFVFVVGYFNMDDVSSYVLIGVLLLSFVIVIHQTILQYKKGRMIKGWVKEKIGKEKPRVLTEREKRKEELKKRIMKIKEAERKARMLEKEEKIKLKELKRKKKEAERTTRLEQKIKRKKEKEAEKKIRKEEKEKLKEDKKLRKEQEKLKKLMKEREEVVRKEEILKPEAKKEEEREKKPAIEAIKKLVKGKGEYETDLDILLGLVDKYSELKISEITRIFGISKEKAEEWGKILESHGLLKIYYPAIGEPSLRRIKK